MSQPFTKRVLESIKPTGRTFTIKDEKTPGLILMVTPVGAKTFYWYRWLAGKPERIKLGTFPAMTIEQARAKAAEVSAVLPRGTTPQKPNGQSVRSPHSPKCSNDTWRKSATGRASL